MAAVTLTTLRARAREHADAVNTQFVTDTATSVDAFINAGLDELYDLVTEKFGSDYFVSSSSFTTTGTSTVSLPSDFYKLLGLDVVSGSDTIDLRRFEFKERNAFKAASIVSATNLPRYRLQGGLLWFYPVPASGLTGTIWYIPTRTLLVSGSDSCNFPNGWEEYAVLVAAEKILLKEESDISAIEALKQTQFRRISAAAENRDAGEPQRVTDVTMPFIGFDPFGGA